MYFFTKLKIFLIQNAIIILLFFILLSYYIYDSKNSEIEQIVKTNEYTIKKLERRGKAINKKKQELIKELNDLQNMINWYKISSIDQRNLRVSLRHLIDDTGLLYVKNIKIKPSEEYINVALVKLSIISKSRYFKVNDFSDTVLNYLRDEYKILQVDKSNPKVLDVYLAWYKLSESDKKKLKSNKENSINEKENSSIEENRETN